MHLLGLILGTEVTSGGKLMLSFRAIRIFLALSPILISTALTAQTHKADDAELRNLMNVYAEAANKADAKLGSQVWCGSEEDSVTNPGGHWQGPQQIKAFYAILSDSYSERKLTFDTFPFTRMAISHGRSLPAISSQSIKTERRSRSTLRKHKSIASHMASGVWYMFITPLSRRHSQARRSNAFREPLQRSNSTSNTAGLRYNNSL